MDLLLGEGTQVGSILFARLPRQEQQMEDFLPSWFLPLSWLRQPIAYSRINADRREYFSFKAGSLARRCPPYRPFPSPAFRQ